MVIGVLDPNDDIKGRGVLRLRDAGIEVAMFDADLMAPIEEMNRDFASQHADLSPIDDALRTADSSDLGAPLGDSRELPTYQRSASRRRRMKCIDWALRAG